AVLRSRDHRAPAENVDSAPEGGQIQRTRAKARRGGAMRLAGKVAAITGGNSGIGLATAREFKANGAKLAILGRSKLTLEQAASALGGETLAVQGDVRKLDNIQ